MPVFTSCIQQITTYTFSATANHRSPSISEFNKNITNDLKSRYGKWDVYVYIKHSYAIFPT